MEDLRILLNREAVKNEQKGLNINIHKTKLMIVSMQQNLKLIVVHQRTNNLSQHV